MEFILNKWWGNDFERTAMLLKITRAVGILDKSPLGDENDKCGSMINSIMPLGELTEATRVEWTSFPTQIPLICDVRCVENQL